MLKALAWIFLAIAVLYGYAMLSMVVMVDVPALMHPDPERDAKLKITVGDAVRHAVLFAACAALGWWLWRYLKRDEP